MNRRIKGQITVFASLVIVLVISVVCASIKSVAMSVAKTNVNAACNLSVESMFAEYSKPLLDEFDVMFFKKTNQLEYKLKSYIEENTKYKTGFTSAKLQSIQMNEIIMATDNGGIPIKQEILDYMNYGILSEAAQMILGSEEQVEKSEKTKEIVDKITECEEYTSKIDSIVLQLITTVEGLDTNENGFKIKNERPLNVEGNFVKIICVGEVSAKNIAVYDAKVYDVLSQKYINVLDILRDMQLCADGISGDIENNLGGISSYDLVFDRKLNQINSLIDSVLEKTLQAIAIAETFDGEVEKVTTSVQNIEQTVESNKSILGEALTDSFSQDLTDLKNYDKTQAQTICDVNHILSCLKSNIDVLNNTKQILNSINSQLNIENADHVMITIGKCVDVISKLDNTKLTFNYTGVDFTSNSAGLSVIHNVIKFITEGVLALVVTDTSKISKKIINYNDLASSQQNGNSNNWSNATKDAKDNVFYNEYLFSKFNSYTDSFDENGEVIETKNLLNYTLEYILCGNNSDLENLKSTIMQLTFIREGTNLAYLFTDSEKKNQSYALALGLLGFTGIHLVIKAGQYLIMSAWAYGESVMDIRKLCSGGKVEIIKNRSNWQLSLENLLAMKFTTDDSETEKGFNYEDYIRILLYVENPNNKYFNTMDAMELKMIEKGYEDFRMRNYVYSLSATAVFSINGKSNYYSQDMQYGY